MDGSLRSARLPGLQNLAGISQALWSKQGYHHGNHCQGISSLVCTGGLRGCGRGWLPFWVWETGEGGSRQTVHLLFPNPSHSQGSCPEHSRKKPGEKS